MPYVPNGGAFDVLFLSARDGSLPGKIPWPMERRDWEVKWDGGWTLAHEAAYGGGLPPDFKFWDLRDSRGVSVLDVHIRRLKALGIKELWEWVTTKG